MNDLQEEQYKLIKKIDLLNNSKELNKVNIISILLFIMFIFITIIIFFLITNKNISFTFHILDSIIFLILLVVIFIIHELIHGLFFKIFKKEARIKFGYSKGMLYASNPEGIYSKKQFIIISLAPFIINTSLLIILMIINFHPAIMLMIMGIHFSGCAGDFYFVYLISKYHSSIYVRDTNIGIDILEKD
ncbi:MAG: DUF3267 domain-containing protein [Bacilli bacterium]|jgi:hypothetical protein|nr:DUF3267 domain-containing protein [Bacilli bacterium]